LALPTVSIAYAQVPMSAAWNHAKQAVWTTCGSCEAADARVHAAADQPGLRDGVERGLHLGGQPHAAVDELGLGGVGELVVRREPLGGDLRAQVEHGVEGLAGVLGVPLALGERGGVEPVVEQEVQVAAGKQQLSAHGAPPCPARR
jgi:hypothetical protein